MANLTLYDHQVLKAASAELRRSGIVMLQNFLIKEESAPSKWEHANNPLKYSYHVAKAPAWAVSQDFKEVLQSLIGKRISLSGVALAKFTKGDYSLLYDSLKPGKGYLFTLDLNDLDEASGGYTSLVNDDGEVHRIIAKKNTLTVAKYAGLRMFTKYVNHHTKTDRIFVIGIATPK